MPRARSNDRPSSGRPSSPTSAEQFALAGPSTHPDPQYHAYRKDLADIALAGSVIASHYAEPVDRTVTEAATLHAAPSSDSDTIRSMAAGERFLMLDDSLGWAWGYAGEDKRVGYVRCEALRR